MKEALNENLKYQVIFDNTGDCETFFRYSGQVVDVNKMVLAMNIGKMKKEEAVEKLRKSLVMSMRMGDRYVLNCGKLNVDFKAMFNDPVNFPVDMIFDYDEGRKNANYKKLVREEEDVDLMGNKKCYWMNDNFDIVVLRDISTDNLTNDKREEFKNNIANFTNSFEYLFVSREKKDGDLSKNTEKNGMGDPLTAASFVNRSKITNAFTFNYGYMFEPLSKPKPNDNPFGSHGYQQ